MYVNIKKYKIFVICITNFNNVEDIETVSVRPSIRIDSPLTATIFYQSLPHLYSMSISLKHFKICSFIKKWQAFSASMHICLFLFLTWNHEGNVLSYFHNTFIKVQHNFSAIFYKFWQKLLPWQHFYFAIFLISSLQKW